MFSFLECEKNIDSYLIKLHFYKKKTSLHKPIYSFDLITQEFDMKA